MISESSMLQYVIVFFILESPENGKYNLLHFTATQVSFFLLCLSVTDCYRLFFLKFSGFLPLLLSLCSLGTRKDIRHLACKKSRTTNSGTVFSGNLQELQGSCASLEFKARHENSLNFRKLRVSLDCFGKRMEGLEKFGICLSWWLVELLRPFRL